MKTVAEEWADYWNTIKPDGPVSDVQEVETKRAFYAGAYSGLGLLYETGKTADTAQGNEESARMAQALVDELEAFFKPIVARGKLMRGGEG